MPLRETIFLVMLGLPVHRLDNEGTDARDARLRVIAAAISDASHHATCSEAYSSSSCTPAWPLAPLDLGVLLVTQAYSESRLAKNVHEGKCREYECDPIRSVVTGKLHHRARSLWQIHRIGPVESEWEAMLGTDLDSTTHAAWAAAKLLSRGYRACNSISGAIARYAGINGCQWSEAEKRARIYRTLRQRASKFESEGPQALRSGTRAPKRTSMR